MTEADLSTDRLQRRLDAALALLLLLFIGLPLALAWSLGQLQRSPQRGQHGRQFNRLSLQLPERGVGGWLARHGAGDWPLLINVLRGDLAWVGPRRLPADPDHPLAALRPGLASPWTIRRRTAVDYGAEDQADLELLQLRSPRENLGVLLRAALVTLLPPPAPPAKGRVRVVDVAFDNLNMVEALARLRDMLDGRKVCQVSFVNPACVNIAASERGYRRALARADLVLPDGIGIKIGSDMLGTPLKQNVNGTDLFPRMCEMFGVRGTKVFLLGGQPGVAEGVGQVIQKNWPGAQVVGTRDGFFTLAQEGEVVAQVRDSGAEVLLVARGVPMQDIFIDRHLDMFGVRIAMGVGGLFDFVSGRIPRAPQWMRDIGLEWFFRLMQEPGRMWRRYLVGNFTFLLRVGLQRLGLRRPAADTWAPVVVEPPAELGHTPAGVAAVLFATQPAAADLPVAAGLPAALLPLGSATLLEHAIAHLARAGVLDIHLVVCDHPEQIRQRVGQGEHWGVRLHWLLSKDPVRPYELLTAARLGAWRHLVIGHAEHWVAPGVVARFANADGLGLALDETSGAVRWTGWAGVAPSALTALPRHAEMATLEATLRQAGVSELALAGHEQARSDGAAALLAAQATTLARPDEDDAIPAAWIRMPWGAMSPRAHVEADAQITGPVRIGPGCLVEAGAQIGPNTVLSQDIIVSAHTRVENSLVLPGSYLGRGLELADTVVNGPRVRHVRLDVETELPSRDGLMLSLHANTAAGSSSWLGRALAGLLLLPLWPLLVLHARRADRRSLPRAWSGQMMVVGRDPRSQRPILSRLRCSRHPGRLGLGKAAELLDVAQGRRRWFGMRARRAAEWYALSPEWQTLLENTPVGWLHAPAWSADDSTRTEAQAAADAFFAVRHGWADKLRIVVAALRGKGASC